VTTLPCGRAGVLVGRRSAAACCKSGPKFGAIALIAPRCVASRLTQDRPSRGACNRCRGASVFGGAAPRGAVSGRIG
ncbi:unnamed protein product, partial [Amoebophrya sp. A120]